MRAAVIVDGKVGNIINVDNLDALPDFDLVDATGAQIGDLWDGERFSRPGGPAEPEAPIVPTSVTRRQARQALLLAGLLDDVPAAITRLDDGTPDGIQAARMATIEWEDSLEFERRRPLVIQIAAAVGLDANALDALFITAAGL